MNNLTVSGTILRFPGPNGWYYVPLHEDQSKELRVLVKSLWPALLPATLSVGTSMWKSSIMPIKDGPLFIALPAKVRKAEGLAEGQKVTVQVNISILI